MVALQLLTCFGLGRAPAPGTVGSLVPVVLALGLAMAGTSAVLIDAAMVLLAATSAAACLRFGAAAEKALRAKDPSQVVADEIAGQAMALVLLPWMPAKADHALLWNGGLAALAFLLFRVLDIAKPGPIRRVQSLGGGAGILLDDLVAGAVAGAVLQACAVAWRLSQG